MASQGTARACESCRSLKAAPCLRCAASGNPCFYTAPKRTKRKRTDVRVRELEAEVKQLGALLRSGQAESEPAPDHSPPAPAPRPAYDGPTLAVPESYAPDPINSGLLSMELAEQLFSKYVSEFAPQRPFVVFSPGTTVANLRATRPILLLAILSSVSGTQDEDLGAILGDLLRRILADRVVIRGEKSVELIQAILISTNWYFAHDSYHHMHFYQHLHMAATMAIDMGLGEPINSLSQGVSLMGFGNEDLRDEDGCDKLECERTLLACYTCCSSLSLAFHRQNMLAHTPNIDNCLGMLEASPNAIPSDAVLVAWVKLMRIVDNSAPALGLRSQSSKVDLSDLSTRLALSNTVKQLEGWKESVPRDHMNMPMLMQYETICCLFHEPCLYGEYDKADFRPPYSIKIPNAGNRNTLGYSMTPDHLSSVTTCLFTAQRLLDIFISAPSTQLQCSPITVYARVGYAIMILLKIYISSISESGALCGVLPPESAEIELYLDGVQQKLQAISALHCRTGTFWLMVFRKTSDWLRHELQPAIHKGVVEIDHMPEIRPLQNIIFEPYSSRSVNLTSFDRPIPQTPGPAAAEGRATTAFDFSQPLGSSAVAGSHEEQVLPAEQVADLMDLFPSIQGADGGCVDFSDWIQTGD